MMPTLRRVIFMDSHEHIQCSCYSSLPSFGLERVASRWCSGCVGIFPCPGPPASAEGQNAFLCSFSSFTFSLHSDTPLLYYTMDAESDLTDFDDYEDKPADKDGDYVIRRALKVPRACTYTSESLFSAQLYFLQSEFLLLTRGLLQTR